MVNRLWDSQRGGSLIRIVLLVALIAAAIPFAASGWSQLYRDYLERTPPVIEVIENPRGVGLVPVSLRLALRDLGAGLDEVVVRVRQRNSSREILRQRLGGVNEFPLSVEFPGRESGLHEGVAYIDIRVFDRSFWSNRAELTLAIRVDYQRPRLELVSSQHNARKGGSQLVFYKALDENLALSGVRVGQQLFTGFPARGIDSMLEDPNLFVAIYAIDASKEEIKPSAVRLFAEDSVGNTSTLSFSNRVLPGRGRRVDVQLSEDYLRGPVTELFNTNMSRIEGRLSEESLQSLAGHKENIPARNFVLLNEVLRKLNDSEILALLSGPRFERLWEGAFEAPSGAIQLEFGNRVRFLWGTQILGEVLKGGYEVRLNPQSRDIRAPNNGIVVFSQNMGVYGRTVAIDHGLGLVSIFSRLENVSVRQGQLVTKGELIGTGGRSGLSRNLHVLISMRVHGVPVDPREWWDRAWFYAHVTEKVDDVKRIYGLPVRRPLR